MGTRGRVSHWIKEKIEKASLRGRSLGESALGTEGLSLHTSFSAERIVERARIPLVLQHFLPGLTFMTDPYDTPILRLTLWAPSTGSQSQGMFAGRKLKIHAPIPNTASAHRKHAQHVWGLEG